MAVLEGPGPFYLTTLTASRDGANNRDLQPVVQGPDGSTVTPTIGTSATTVLMKPYTVGSVQGTSNTIQNFGWNLGVAQTDAVAQLPCSRQIPVGTWTVTGVLGIQSGVGFPVGGSVTVHCQVFARKALDGTGRFIAGGIVAVGLILAQSVVFNISMYIDTVVLSAGETLHLEFYIDCPPALLTNYVIAMTTGTFTVTNLTVANAAVTLPNPGLRFRFLRVQTASVASYGNVKGIVVKYLAGALATTGAIKKLTAKYLTGFVGPRGTQTSTALVAVARSGSPDADAWGDAWTDATTGNAGNNHGNDANLLVSGSPTGIKNVYIMVDLTSYAGKTVAPGGLHTLGLYIAESGSSGGGSTYNVLITTTSTRPFVESAVTSASPPTTGNTQITYQIFRASGGSYFENTGFNDAQMQSLLGKWVMITLSCPNSIDSGTVISRENAGATVRPTLSFVTQTGTGQPIAGGLVKTALKRFATGNVVMPGAVLVKTDKKIVGSVDGTSGALVKTPKKYLRGQLGTPDVTTVLTAVSRSGTPDADTWGDTWTDATLGSTGNTHGSDTILYVKGTVGSESRAYIEVDLTAYAGKTAVGNNHTFSVFSYEAAPTSSGSSVIIDIYAKPTRPFVESTSSQSNLTAGNLGTFVGQINYQQSDGATGLYTMSFSDSAMQAGLGNWLSFEVRGFSAVDQVQLQSREAPTPPSLIFTTGTGLGKPMTGSLAKRVSKTLASLVAPTGTNRNTVVKHLAGYFYNASGSGLVKRAVTYIFGD